MTKAESEQLARALQEEQYFELSQENKKAAARYKQEMCEKEATISRVRISHQHLSNCSNKKVLEFKWDEILAFFPQLEESNKTLTKDVDNLSKEKTDLSEKLQTQEEGTVLAVSGPKSYGTGRVRMGQFALSEGVQSIPNKLAVP